MVLVGEGGVVFLIQLGLFDTLARLELFLVLGSSPALNARFPQLSQFRSAFVRENELQIFGIFRSNRVNRAIQVAPIIPVLLSPPTQERRFGSGIKIRRAQTLLQHVLRRRFPPLHSELAPALVFQNRFLPLLAPLVVLDQRLQHCLEPELREQHAAFVEVGNDRLLHFRVSLRRRLALHQDFEYVHYFGDGLSMARISICPE